jgi:hypothetical protein
MTIEKFTPPYDTADFFGERKARKVTTVVQHFGATKGNANKCWYCGQEEVCTKDHFVPRSKGGKIKVYACRLCQRTKGHMMPLEWLEYITSHIVVRDDLKERIKTSILSLLNK